MENGHNLMSPVCFFPKEMECPIHSTSFLNFTKNDTLCLYVHINAWAIWENKENFYQWKTKGEEAFKVMVL